LCSEESYMNRGGFGHIICMNEQFTVDYIRNYHERYLKIWG